MIVHYPVIAEMIISCSVAKVPKVHGSFDLHMKRTDSQKPVHVCDKHTKTLAGCISALTLPTMNRHDADTKKTLQGGPTFSNLK